MTTTVDFWTGSTSQIPVSWRNELGSSWFAYVDADAALFLITFFAAVLQVLTSRGTRLRLSLRTFALSCIVCGSFCNILWLLDPTGGSLGGIGSSFVDSPSVSLYSSPIRSALGSAANAFHSLAIAILILIWRQILKAAATGSVNSSTTTTSTITSSTSTTNADDGNASRTSHVLFVVISICLVLTVVVSGLSSGGVIDEIIGASIIRAYIGFLTLCFCSFGVAFGAQLHTLLIKSSTNTRKRRKNNAIKNSSSSLSTPSTLSSLSSSSPQPTNNSPVVSTTLHDWEETRRGIDDIYSSARARVSATICRVIVLPLTFCAISMLFWSVSFAIAMQTRFVGSQLFLIHLSSTQLASLVAAWVVLMSLWIRRRSFRDGLDDSRKISAALKAKLIDIWDEPSLFLALSVNQSSVNQSSSSSSSSSSSAPESSQSQNIQRNSTGRSGSTSSSTTTSSTSPSPPLPEISSTSSMTISTDGTTNSNNNTHSSENSAIIKDLNGIPSSSSSSSSSDLTASSSSSVFLQSHQRRAQIASSRSPQSSMNLQLIPLDTVLASADLSARVIAAQRNELETIMAEHALLQAGIAAEYNSNRVEGNMSRSETTIQSGTSSTFSSTSNSNSNSTTSVQIVRNPLQFPRLLSSTESSTTLQQTFEPTGDSATDTAILAILHDNNRITNGSPLQQQQQQQQQVAQSNNGSSSTSQSELPVSFVQWLINEWPKRNTNSREDRDNVAGSTSSLQQAAPPLSRAVNLQQQQQQEQDHHLVNDNDGEDDGHIISDEGHIISQSVPSITSELDPSYFDFEDGEGYYDTMNELQVDVDNSSASDMYDSVLASYLSNAGGVAGSLAARATERILDRYDATSSSSSSSLPPLSSSFSSPSWMMGRLGWLAGASSSSSSLLPERNSRVSNLASGGGGGGGGGAQRPPAETEMMTMTVNTSIKGAPTRKDGGIEVEGSNGKGSETTGTKTKASSESNPFRVLAKAVRAHVAAHAQPSATTTTSSSSSSSSLSSSWRGGIVPGRVNRSSSRGSHKDSAKTLDTINHDAEESSGGAHNDDAMTTFSKSFKKVTGANNNDDNGDDGDSDDDDDDAESAAHRRRQRQAQLVASLRARGMILPAALRSGEQEIDDYVAGGDAENGASEGSDISGWRDDDGSTDGANDGGVGIGGVKSRQRALPIEQLGGSRGGAGDDRRRSRSVA